jgi:hypothetical protein
MNVIVVVVPTFICYYKVLSSVVHDDVGLPEIWID